MQKSSRTISSTIITWIWPKRCVGSGLVAFHACGTRLAFALTWCFQDKALDQRKQQKRLSVAVDIERRATMAGNVRRSLVKKTQTVTPGGGHASAAHGAGGASSSGAAIVSLFVFICLVRALSNRFCSELQALNSKVSKLSQDVGQIATKVTALEQEQAALRGLVQP